MRPREWQDVPAVVELPAVLVIRLRCSGFYDPGYWRDANGDGCPPGGEDNREVESIEIVTESGVTIGLSGVDAEAVKRLFTYDIDNAELKEINDERSTETRE